MDLDQPNNEATAYFTTVATSEFFVFFGFLLIIQEPSYASRINLESTSYKDGIDPYHDSGDIKILLSHDNHQVSNI